MFWPKVSRFWLKSPKTNASVMPNAVLISFILLLIKLNMNVLEASFPDVLPYRLVMIILGPWVSLATVIPKRGLVLVSGYHLVSSKAASSFSEKIVVTPANWFLRSGDSLLSVVNTLAFMLVEPKEEPLDSSVFKMYSLWGSILVSVKQNTEALDLM